VVERVRAERADALDDGSRRAREGVHVAVAVACDWFE